MANQKDVADFVSAEPTTEQTENEIPSAFTPGAPGFLNGISPDWITQDEMIAAEQKKFDDLAKGKP